MNKIQVGICNRNGEFASYLVSFASLTGPENPSTCLLDIMESKRFALFAMWLGLSLVNSLPFVQNLRSHALPQNPYRCMPHKISFRPGIKTLRRRDLALFSTKKDDERDVDENFSVGPNKSQLTNYILDFLNKNNEPDAPEDASDMAPDISENQQHTHLVAIPMENCHELLLELESIQRAILYHCPILVHACIAQVTTRLPLLYVTVDKASTSTQKLSDIVEEVVRETLLKLPPATKDEYGLEINPFMLRFKNLEMDGSKNEVLQTVAVDENAAVLKGMVESLQERIHSETAWKTELPLDPHSDVFRPRIPFMRLPNDWEAILAKEIGDDEDRILMSDEGGNGISPILWYKWWEDDFGLARMREVAVYKGKEDYQGLNEQTYQFPAKSIELPRGDANLTRQELKFRDYQENRMLETFMEDMVKEDQPKSIPSKKADTTDDDFLLEKTRNRLESLYVSSASKEDGPEIIEDAPMSSSTPESIDAETIGSGPEKNVLENPVERLGDPEAMDDWTRQRIQQVIASRAKVKSEQELSRQKEKPPVEQNEVFAKYKQGTLVPKQEDVVPKPELPPFPSREHCTGFWRVVASPTGFMVEEGDASRSDNLVLRVDGTTAGGPILDQETHQKASGGTWRFQGRTVDDAGLLIRLVIPPEKDRVLVMDGRLLRASFSSDYQLAGSSFGIPEIEKRKAKAAGEMEDLLFCTGNVWIEDAVTKANREDIGTFSITKMNISTNPNSYTITVPRPVRNQD